MKSLLNHKYPIGSYVLLTTDFKWSNGKLAKIIKYSYNDDCNYIINLVTNKQWFFGEYAFSETEFLPIKNLNLVKLALL